MYSLEYNNYTKLTNLVALGRCQAMVGRTPLEQEDSTLMIKSALFEVHNLRSLNDRAPNILPQVTTSKSRFLRWTLVGRTAAQCACVHLPITFPMEVARYMWGLANAYIAISGHPILRWILDLGINELIGPQIRVKTCLSPL